MFIEKKNRHEIPRNAVVLSETDVLDHYHNKIRNWKNKLETWPFEWSSAILCVPLLIGTANLITYFRNRTRIGNAGKFTLYFTVAGLPAIGSSVFNRMFILPDILLQKDCHYCTYLKAASLQSLTFLAYGCICAPSAIFLIALQTYTYPIPGISNRSEIKETFNLYLKFMKRIVPRITYYTIFNVTVAVFITYQQYSAFEVLNKKLYEKEQELITRTRKLHQQ